jgi:hypothetical protein
VLWHQNNK